MKYLKIYIVFLLGCGVGLKSFAQTEVIHCWDFNGTTPFTSPVNVDNRVAGNGTITHNISNVQNFSGNTSNSCVGSDAGNAFSPTDQANNDKYFDLNFSTLGYKNIELSFWARRTGTGFQNNLIMYSVNGGSDFTTLTSNTPTNSPGGNTYTFDFSSVDDVNDNPNFIIRFILKGASTNDGNNRYDNIKLEGIPTGLNQFTINFDDDAKWTAGSGGITSYQSDHMFEDKDWLFTGGPALRNTTADEDGFTGALGEYAWRLRDAAGVEWTATYQGEELITEFGFEVRRWDDNPTPNYNIEYSFDGGANYIDTGDVINNAFLGNSSNWFTYEFELPSIQHHDTDDFVVRLKRNGGERIMIDNFSFAIALEDKDSKILALDPQIPEGELVVGEAIFTNDAEPVFAFKLEDLGTDDGLPTKVNSMRFVAGPQNTANFEELVENIVVRVNGDRIFNAARTLTLAENIIEISFDYDYTSGGGGGQPNNLLVIPDGESRNIEISMSLKTEGIQSGDNIQLAIDDNSLGFGVEQESSIFSREIIPIVGNEFEVKVNATQLQFIQESQYAKVNNAMPFDISVAATDDNGNIDRSFEGEVELTSSGTLQGSPLTANAIEGVATFPAIIHTELGEGLILTATDQANASIGGTSLSFNIRNPLELFITEVADPSDDFEGRYVEVFNHGVDTIDFGTQDIFLVIESNGGNSYQNIKLIGALPPKSYYLIGRNNFDTVYGFSSNITSNLVINGNGDDSYFLSFGVGSNMERKRNFFDIYGEFGVQAVDGTDAWFYEDRLAYRKNPPVIEETQIWDSEEWEITIGGSSIATPGFGNQDYIYVNDSVEWNEIGLGSNFENSDENNNIEIRSGEVTFSNPILVNDLVVRSGAKLTIEDIVTVKGDFVNLGEVIFASDEIKTAVLGQASERSRIRGEFEIHRYIPPQRAFRYLSPSVTTTESINENWQEGITNVGFNYPGDNITGTPGFGTHITGSQSGANGFDATETGNPSMFTWNVDQTWQPIPNTDEDNLVVGKAYAILIRGDRSISLDANENVGGPTRLRSTGELHVGDFPVTDLAATNDHFNLIGNPYQSQVDMLALLSSTTGLNQNTVYIYDPTLGDRGAYATVDLASETTPTPVPEDSDANQYLQPNQAFFVQSTGGSPSLTFTEDTKDNTSEPQTTTFSTATPQVNYINLTLKDDEDKVRDGVRVVFDDSYAAGIDYFDAVKVWNFDESLTIYSHQNELSIEKRPLPTAADTTQLHLYNYTKSNYTFQLEWVANTNPNQQVFLVDQYLDTQVELVQNQVNFYHYTVENAIPTSKATDRFLLTNEVNPLSINSFKEETLLVYPNPVTESEVYVHLPTKNGIVSNLQIIIFDLVGNQIMSQEMQNTAQPILLHTGVLSTGMYMLHVKDGQNTYTKKLIVQE